MEDVVIRSGDGSCCYCGDVHEQVLSKDEEGYVSKWVGCGDPEQVERLTPEQALEVLKRRSRRLYGDEGFFAENNRNAEAMLKSLE